MKIKGFNPKKNVKKQYLNNNNGESNLPNKHKTMTKKLLDSFFLNLGKEIKSKELNAELVEATINQYKAEIKEQIIALEELSKVHKQENQLISQAFAEGQKQSLEKSILLLRKLHTDILWKQLNINMNEKS